MADKKYDVIVIGAGPAGYVAAIRCAQLGLSTACVDAWTVATDKPSPGGTCLNVGCIPSKALLDSSHHYSFLREQAAEHGIRAGEVSMDVPAMQKRKAKVVQTLTKGVAGLFKKNNIDFVHGRARIDDAKPGDHRLLVAPVEGGEAVTLSTANMILATGSVPAPLDVVPVNGETIVDSTGALDFQQIPSRLGVIGAGVIGLELGSVWNRLGAEVTILEALDTFLPALDRELARDALKVFNQQGLDIRLSAKVTAAKEAGAGVQVDYEDADGNQRLEFDKLIVAVGRRPYTDDLGAAEVGIELDRRGFIAVDDYCRTKMEGIWAIGDAVRGPMLAHKGSEEGVMVAERIAGRAGHVNYETIPWVIYTWPEIAWVGQNEEQLKQSEIDYRSGVFPLLASGRARAMGETAGKVKILADSKTDRILGVYIFAAQASELIAEAVTAMEFDAAAEDLARTVHAHPTLSEATHEAALAVAGRPIHI